MARAVRGTRNSSASCTWRRRRACATRSKDPHSYIASNVAGTLNVLEGCRRNSVEHLVYASTSSVYGANTRMPFSVHAAGGRTRCRSMRRASAPPSSWRTVTRRCSACRPRACGSSRSTGPGAGPTWRCSCSRARSSRASRSRCSTTAITSAISPTSTTSPRAIVRSLDQVASAESALEQRRPGPGHQPRSLSHLQHRQQSADRAAALHRGARAMPWRRKRRTRDAAAAAGRRARDLRRRDRARRGGRLRAADADRGRRAQLRLLVPGVLPVVEPRRRIERARVRCLADRCSLPRRRLRDGADARAVRRGRRSATRIARWRRRACCSTTRGSA